MFDSFSVVLLQRKKTSLLLKSCCDLVTSKGCVKPSMAGLDWDNLLETEDLFPKQKTVLNPMKRNL